MGTEWIEDVTNTQVEVIKKVWPDANPDDMLKVICNAVYDFAMEHDLEYTDFKKILLESAEEIKRARGIK